MLAVTGGKGGCGKTTTALGLGRFGPGDHVVVDADRDMPNLHALAGVEREPTALAVDPHRIDDDCAVLPAPPPSTTDAAMTTLLTRVGRETDDSLIVDCPGGAGPDAVAPLSVASEAVVVSTPCAPALRDAAKTAAMARAVGCRVRGVVLTRTAVVPSGVERLFDAPVLATVPDVPGRVLSDERVRRAYATLAGELAGWTREVNGPT